MSSKRAAHNTTIKPLYSHILENTRIKVPKNANQLERLFKGVANHWRIEILRLIAAHKGITLEKISELLDCNFKTLSGHTQKLVQAGLIEKKYQGQSVLHSLTEQGRVLHTFLQSF